MTLQLLVDNLLSPPILFFALGVMAVAARSDLEVPQPIAKFLSLYLLFAIGLHGGHALAQSGVTIHVATSLGAALVMAVVVPVYSFYLLRLRVDASNAAAIAATYGSVSAVTFVTAAAFVQRVGIDFGGHMVAAMALMEAPAIVIGVLLLRTSTRAVPGRGAPPLAELLREACLNGSVVLILGSLVIGLVTGDRGWAGMQPFAGDIFKGMLAFFLLDMGILAARRLRDLRAGGWFLPAFALGMPLLNAALGVAVAYLAGLPTGDAIMFVVLCASASYIAVPAAMRLAIPEASPSLYVSLSLGITFPFNIVLGIPLYAWVVRTLWQ
jgi:uncharacterized protein